MRDEARTASWWSEPGTWPKAGALVGEGVETESELAAPRTIVAEAAALVERFHREVPAATLAPTVSAAEIRSRLASEFVGFESGRDERELLTAVDGMMRAWTLHITHPRYFGLFNPNVTPASVAGDVLVAGYNPQLAAWSHAPFANEVERYVLEVLGNRLGLEAPFRANFTSGGAEANHSAILVALVHQFPEIVEDGLAAAPRALCFYASAQSHHSLVKIAVACGLGRGAVRAVPGDHHSRLEVNELRSMIERDRELGRQPFAVVATVGTTAGGAIDPVPAIADLCAEQSLWLHVDAAWAGAACLSKRLASCLDGVERADSITWDAHKWLSVPMAAGMFFCRHPRSVDRAFDIATPYMPARAGGETLDPYSSTLQWSRRCIGLKVFMSLAAVGLDGYAAIIDHQVAMGDLLRTELRARGWTIVNRTPLPLVCFSRAEIDDGRVAASAIANLLYQDDIWISPITLSGDVPVLRACVTNHETRAVDVVALADSVSKRFAELC